MIKNIRYFLYVIIVMITVVTVFPLLLLRPFNPKNNSLLHRYFRFLVSHLLCFDVEVEGYENLENNIPAVVIANHQHNYDAFTVSKLFNIKMVALGKFELGLIPIFGWVFVLAGNLLIRRSNSKKALEKMSKLEKRIVDTKTSILIFPEGHRNHGKGLLNFKKGAFHTAINTGFPIIPVSVSNYLTKASLNSAKKSKIFLKVHPPIETKNLTKDDLEKLMDKARSVIQDGVHLLNKKYS